MGQGLLGPHPTSERMRRGCCWGDGPSAPPRAHQAPTCQPRVEGRDPGAAWPWCPQLLMGRRQSSVEGRPALGLPLPCPAPARQLAQTQVSLPGGSQRLESPVVRARLGLMRPRLAGGLMSSWGKVGAGGWPSPTPRLFPISRLVSLQADLPIIHSFNTWLPSALLLLP